MTPQAWYDKNKNTAVVVPLIGPDEAGQCWVTATSFLHDVFALPYLYTSAAINVWNQSLLDAYGWTKIAVGQPIRPSDLIFYDRRVGAIQGHVSIASQSGTSTDFYSWDSNWDRVNYHNAQGFPTLHTEHHTGVLNTYIVGYYRPPGGKGADTITSMLDEDGAKDLYRGLLHREPENDKVWREWVGKDYATAYKAFCGSQEWLTQNHIIKVAYPAAVARIAALEKQVNVTPEDVSFLVKLVAKLTK